MDNRLGMRMSTGLCACVCVCLRACVCARLFRLTCSRSQKGKRPTASSVGVCTGALPPPLDRLSFRLPSLSPSKSCGHYVVRSSLASLRPYLGAGTLPAKCIGELHSCGGSPTGPGGGLMGRLRTGSSFSFPLHLLLCVHLSASFFGSFVLFPISVLSFV